MFSRRSAVVIAILAALPATRPAWTQQDMGYITGLVTDQSGAVVPGATVVVTEVQTGVRTTAQTTATGNYTAGPLKIGVYDVVVEEQGFKRVVVEGVKISAQSRRRVDLVLEVGAVTESVTTTAAAPLLETESATVGQVVEETVIRQLPLNSRNFQTLALLAPGTSPSRGRDSAGGFNAQGQAFFENNFIIDGIDNNSWGFAFEDRKAQVVIPSLDAVQEFKVETANYSAEFGRTAGAVMNVSIRSGTNEVHGTAYEYMRNDVFDARDTFSYVDRDGDGKADAAQLRQNQFGFTLGGPIIKNKTFLFGSWEAWRVRHPQSFTNIVPTAEVREGIYDPALFGAIKDPLTGKPFPGNTIPKSRFDPVAPKIIDLYPAPNFAGSGTRANYVSSTPWKETRDQIDIRGDHNFNDNNKLFLRTSFTRFLNERYPSLPLPARGPEGFTHNKSDNPAVSAVLSYTRVMSPTTVNEARLGFSRLNVQVVPFEEEWEAPKFGIKVPQPDNRITGLPRFEFSGTYGYANLGSSWWAPTQKIGENWQILDNITKIRGSHTLKGGIDIRFTRAYNFSAQWGPSDFRYNGRYTGVSMADFQLGWTDRFRQSNLQDVDAYFQSYMFYFQDDWKVTPSLTVNLGLRYELTSPMWERFNKLNTINLDPARPDFGQFTYAGEKGDGWSERALINTDTNNWGPRVGLAYQLTRKLTLRAGAGIFYGGYDRTGTAARGFANWPFNVRKTLTATPTKPAILLSEGVSSDFLDPGDSLPRNSNLYHWSTNYPLTQVGQWNFSIQRQITSDMVFKAAYVGSSTSFVHGNYDWNAPFIGDPKTERQRRVFPDIAAIDYHAPLGHASYNGLNLQLEKRYSAGLAFTAAYTWSKALSNENEQFGEGLGMQDPWNWDNNRAVSGTAPSQRFVASYVWELPFGDGRRWLNTGGIANVLLGGWQLNGIISMRTGLLYNPTLPNAQANLGTVKVGQWRPDRIRKGTVENPTTEMWFDPSAFVRPCDGGGCRLGNAGANILTSGGQFNKDFGLSKYFRLSERFRLQFRWEVFNLTNTPAYSPPNANIESPDVGKVRGTYSSPRIMQFALRLEF